MSIARIPLRAPFSFTMRELIMRESVTILRIEFSPVNHLDLPSKTTLLLSRHSANVREMQLL